MLINERILVVVIILSYKSINLETLGEIINEG